MKRRILLYSIKLPNKKLPYTNGGSLIIYDDKYILKYFGNLHTFDKNKTKFEKAEDDFLIFKIVRIYDDEVSYDLIITPNTLEKLNRILKSD